jgi:tRNA (guanine-N7-)-methyltransferase
MVNKELVDAVAAKLSPGGLIFVQTDIEFLAHEMFDLFRANADLIEERITDNPFPVKTEREKAVEEKGLSVFRSIYLAEARTE